MNLNFYIYDFLKRHRGWSVANFILILFNYPLEIVLISFLSGQIFSNINNLKKNSHHLKWLFFYIILAYFILEMSITIKDRVDIKYYPLLERELKLGIVDIVLKKIEINYDNVETGELVARLLKVPIHVSLMFDRVNKYLLPFLITFLIVIIYLFYINWKMGLIGTGMIAIYLLVFGILSYKNIKISMDREQNENNLMKKIDDKLQNSLNILTSGQTSYEQKRLFLLHQDYEKTMKKEMKESANIKLVTAILNVILFTILIVSSLYFYSKSQISPAYTISLITMSLFLVKHLRSLSRRVCEGLVFFGKVNENNEFIKSLKKKTYENGKKEGFIKNGQIEFHQVSFHYHNRPILNHKSFLVKPKELVALVGKSGSGKSTTLNLLLGFYQKQKGKILIDGVDISKINRDYLRSKISMVNQKTILFNETVLENINYGNNFSKPHLLRELGKLEVMSIFNNLPDGLDSNVGKLGDKLSGGQKQVVLLLRSYFRKNPIILLDEPTSSVDDEHKKYVYQMIKKLNENSTVLVVTHDQGLSNLISKKITF